MTVGADRRFEFAKCYKVILDGGDFELSRRRGALRSRGRKQQLYALNCSDGCVSERGLIRRVLIKDSYNTVVMRLERDKSGRGEKWNGRRRLEDETAVVGGGVGAAIGALFRSRNSV